jgi:RHS repeat-associated protein
MIKAKSINILADTVNWRFIYTPDITTDNGTHSTFLNADSKHPQTTSATKQYDAFGNETTSTGTWQGPFQYGGSFGDQTDGDSGLKLLGHRYYDSSIGRFLTRDPIKDGRNWFAYCRADPIGSADPSGLSPKWRNVYIKFPSRGAALEAAIADSARGRAPIEHSNPLVGNPHFHAVDGQGRKRTNPNVHYEYPRRHSTPPMRLAPVPVPVNPAPDTAAESPGRGHSRSSGINWGIVGAWVLVGVVVVGAVVVSVATGGAAAPAAAAATTAAAGVVIVSTGVEDPGA